MTNKAGRKIQNERKERKYGMVEIISTLISAMSFIISLIALNYANKEYEYKLDPEVTTLAKIKVESYKVDDTIENQLSSYGVKIKILNKNNLEKAYLIYPNNIVKKLSINDIEKTIEENLNENIRFDNYDMELGGQFYQYRFLFLTGIDDSYEMYIIYAKTDSKKNIQIDCVSGVEVWGFENSNKDNPEYEGERFMAKQYKEILEGSSNYIK
ncbi:hypothetical protein ACV3XK_16580 [Clostridium perfringens]